MLVNFSFYIQKFHDIDAEYRIILTIFDESTYSRNIIKEGFLYSNGKIINKDQVVLDLPINEFDSIKNHFELHIAAIQTARTNLNKPIKLDLMQLEIDGTVVKTYLKKHIVHNAMVSKDRTGLIIPSNARIKQKQ